MNQWVHWKIGLLMFSVRISSWQLNERAHFLNLSLITNIVTEKVSCFLDPLKPIQNKNIRFIERKCIFLPQRKVDLLKGKISRIDLHVLTNSRSAVFKIEKMHTFFYKTTFLNEVNRSETFPSVRVPWIVKCIYSVLAMEVRQAGETSGADGRNFFFPERSLVDFDDIGCRT
jgi:hypothetical protein